MRIGSLRLVLPDGASHVLEVGEADIHLRLSAFLARRGFPLNTRCGGRGLCRGCMVGIEVGRQAVGGAAIECVQSGIAGRSSGSGASQEWRACQHVLAEFFQIPATIGLQIPKSSLADHSLCGVSEFDLRLPKGAKRRSLDGKKIGVAFDIGTTTLAGAVWDLQTGLCLKTGTKANPQRCFGDDVLSRISYAVSNLHGVRDLQHVLIEKGIAPLLREMLQSAEIKFPPDLVVVAGNPTMLQSLTGDALDGLARFPFFTAWQGGARSQLHNSGLCPNWREMNGSCCPRSGLSSARILSPVHLPPECWKNQKHRC